MSNNAESNNSGCEKGLGYATEGKGIVGRDLEDNESGRKFVAVEANRVEFVIIQDRSMHNLLLM